MTAEGPLIVKLGGSVITRKKGEARLRPKVLHRLAEELGEAPPSLIVLHGAGSFGHPGAKRFRLAEEAAAGADAQRRRARGAAIVGAEVRRLHLSVLSALIESGLSAQSLPPAALARNRSGKLSSLDAAPFQAFLDRGMVPVSFGDVVPDENWGFSILSADTLALELARGLGARRVLFVSDVDGLLAPAPAGGGRRPVVERPTRETLAALSTSSAVPDVTGGIAGKLGTMLAIGDAGVPAGLISGLRHGALSRAAKGERVYGSWTGPVG